jgi:HSP20 family protein
MFDLTLWQDDMFTRLDSAFRGLVDFDIDNRFTNTLKKSGYPKVNIVENTDNTIIEATVPGLTKNDVVVDWKNNILTLSYKKCEKTESKDKNYIVREIHQSNFSRSFTVNKLDYKVDEVTAKVENGMLTIIIPRTKNWDKPEVKKINVE